MSVFSDSDLKSPERELQQYRRQRSADGREMEEEDEVISTAVSSSVNSPQTEDRRPGSTQW